MLSIGSGQRVQGEQRQQQLPAAVANGGLVTVTVQGVVTDVTPQYGGGRINPVNRSGQYVAPTVRTCSDFATIAIGANLLYAWPFHISQSITIDQVAARLAGGNAGGRNARIGIYAPAASGIPGARLLDSGDIDCAALGRKTAAVSLTLTPGLYFWAMNMNSGLLSFESQAPAHFASYFGVLLTNAAGTDAGFVMNVALAYGALPATFPGGFTVGGAGITPSLPVLAMRIA